MWDPYIIFSGILDFPSFLFLAPMAPEDPLAPSVNLNPSDSTTSTAIPVGTPQVPTLANHSSAEQYVNPYFVHHSDNRSLVLVSDLLTDDNYTSWSRFMTIALTVNNKIGFVDGSISRPASGLLNS